VEGKMLAMVLEKKGKALAKRDVPVPQPGEQQVLIKVEACGVCRTDLHVIDGELAEPNLPLVPGHEIVGKIVKRGPGAKRFETGIKVGVPWLARTCGRCSYCRKGLENLCDNALFTGYTVDGGYAEYMVAWQDYIHEIPPGYSSTEAAPLLCAGLIGYRSYRMAGTARNLGLYGFGAAAHIICQIAASEGKNVFAFTRDGDEEKQEFARSLGAVWASGSSSIPDETLDAAIIFAPAGHLVPKALSVVDKAGSVICAGIYMTDIPSFPYNILWWEKKVQSVANLTRKDGRSFMKVAAHCLIKLHITTFPLEEANSAISAVRDGKIKGAAILVP
jgi:propanol-preferring alcohol dehydrogenase